MSQDIHYFKTWLIKEMLYSSRCSYAEAIEEVKSYVDTQEGKTAFKKWQSFQPSLKKQSSPLRHISDCLKRY